MKPFNKDYVISLTLRHMKNDIEFSISKTLSRVGEFEGDAVKSMELMQTLSILHEMKRDIEKMNAAIANKVGDLTNVSS